jgi:tryptophan 2,3-dioxygenase
MEKNEIYYNDYLQLDKILNSQSPESDKSGVETHDEMLFIIIHQAYELWFKEILYEIDSVRAIMSKPVNDNYPALQTVVHRMERINTILKVLVHQIDILETMTPMDFLDFRDLLRPASGFQSWQFKVIEAKLGLKYQDRHGQEYYISQLRKEHRKMIKEVETQPSLLDLLNAWLERMPFFEEQDNWNNFRPTHPVKEGIHPFWSEYRNIYQNSLVEGEKGNISYFDEVFYSGNAKERNLSPKACRSALFIMLYRGYPLLHLPYRLLNNLMEMDEQLSTWRFRHMKMVERMIGARTGTGGTTGKEYLKGALDKHYIFKEVTVLTSFLIERRKLPVLSKEMERRMGFV